MNYCQKYLSAGLLGIAALAIGASPAFADGRGDGRGDHRGDDRDDHRGVAPSLGAASGFAVLSVGTATPPSTTTDATAAVTLTRTTVTGNVGSAGAVTLTDSTITGNVVLSGFLTNTTSTISGTSTPLPVGVITAFNAAYAALAPTAGECNTTNTLTGTLDGGNVAPGVYCVDAAAKAGTLTLIGPANGTWTFKVVAFPQTPTPTGALTGTDFSVVLANGASSACNVTWWVAEAATITRGAFKGIILAGAAIDMTGTVHTAGTPPVETYFGGALAKAAVTLKDVALVGCEGRSLGGTEHPKCNQGVGNGPEGCDPGNSNQGNPFPFRSNDELGGVPGNPGRKGGNK